MLKILIVLIAFVLWPDLLFAESLIEELGALAKEEPIRPVATAIFFLAIIHTFLSSKILFWSYQIKQRFFEKRDNGLIPKKKQPIVAELLHFVGEVEVIFGLWVLVLGAAFVFFYDWHTMVEYIAIKVNYKEPIFVVVIMAMASTRPILKLTELILWKIASRMGGSLPAWWFCILTLTPLFGSLITESAAMTIAAMLLADKFFQLKPSETLSYATISLLFVNISVGGSLTHFSAPPILMVAESWHWDTPFMFLNFGWKAIVALLISNVLYYYRFKEEFWQLQKRHLEVQARRYYQRKYVSRELLESELESLNFAIDKKTSFMMSLDHAALEIRNTIQQKSYEELNGNKDLKEIQEAIDERFEYIKKQELAKTLPGLLPKSERPLYRDPNWDTREDQVPVWLMLVHCLFIFWTVLNAHYPALFMGGFLFFLGFTQATRYYQNRINLKPPLLVGFFLAGLVIHGGMQAWWIAPLLGKLSDFTLMLSSTLLTAFNDNASITFLSTFIPDISSSMKYAVVAGALTGGGLTVIANAPNPAGQSILKGFFQHGVSPARLVKEAAIPTLIVGACFWFLP